MPGKRQLVGLAVGFLGVAVISWPQMQGADATLLGIGLVVLATTLYGLASNLAVPLQQRYGALPVLLRAQLAALAILLGVGVLNEELAPTAVAGTALVLAGAWLASRAEQRKPPRLPER